MTEFDPAARTLLALSGKDTEHFLQGILTQDVSRLRDARIQFAALLSPQGKILHDLFLVDAAAMGGPAGTVLIDTPAAFADTLKKRLALYKLRAKVTVADAAEWSVTFGQGLPDPRHPQLPLRHYAQGGASQPADLAASRTLGIPESTVDFAPDEVVALDGGYDLLYAVSFTKGCYVGQEVTARMHYKSIARKGFYQLSQNGAVTRLALLKFEDVEKADGVVMLGSETYQATLPDWMQPKLDQYRANRSEA